MRRYGSKGSALQRYAASDHVKTPRSGHYRDTQSGGKPEVLLVGPGRDGYAPLSLKNSSGPPNGTLKSPAASVFAEKTSSPSAVKFRRPCRIVPTASLPRLETPQARLTEARKALDKLRRTHDPALLPESIIDRCGIGRMLEIAMPRSGQVGRYHQAGDPSAQ